MNRRSLIVLAIAAVGALATGLLATLTFDRPAGQGIVSLTPAITDTLVAIGAADQIIGRSDWCSAPEVQDRTAVGSALTPNLELIAALHPAMVIVDGSGGARTDLLEPLAPLQVLPWLTIDEITSSIRKIGGLTGHESQADELAERLHTRLAVPAPDGPKTLVVLSVERGGPVWFIKRNSLHGSAMHAAGLRNAVDEDVSGPPNLSYEALIALNPDQIVFLLPLEAQPEDFEDAVHAFDELTPLSAVQDQRIRAVAGDLLGTGPRILDLVDALERFATPDAK